MAQHKVHGDAFIVRIWHEGSIQTWKGWVQHASSGAATPISSPLDLLSFIERHTGFSYQSDKETSSQKGGLK